MENLCRFALAFVCVLLGAGAAWIVSGTILTLGYVEGDDAHVLTRSAQIASDLSYGIGVVVGIAAGFVLWRRPR